MRTLFVILLIISTWAAIGHPQKEDDFSIVETVKAPDPQIQKGLESITKTDCKALLTFLSSDSLEGREVTSRGYLIAAEFAAAIFAKNGAKPAGDRPRWYQRRYSAKPRKKKKETRGYFQIFPMVETVETDSQLVAGRSSGPITEVKTFSPDVDYYFSPKDSYTLKAPVVFVGYGISEKKLKFDEYKGLDVKGKIVMMLTEIPGKDDKQSPFQKGDLKKKYYSQRTKRYKLLSKIAMARKKGAAAVLFVKNSPRVDGDIANFIIDKDKINDEPSIHSKKRRRLSLLEGGISLRGDTLPRISISRQMADRILKMAGEASIQTLKQRIEKDLKPMSKELTGISLTITTTAKTQVKGCRNVLAYFEGSDPELKDEVVVVGAHLDHLGKKGDYIFNGADDNGSGSVAVLEVAEAIAAGQIKPKRSVLLALWTGEESGLLGSSFYVSNPTFPLKKTVAYINLDMVSRSWTQKSYNRASRLWGITVPEPIKDKLEVEKLVTISFDAESNGMAAALRENNQFVGLHIYLKEEKSLISGGSDHAPFAMKKIPWIKFFASQHDDFHKPSDTVDKVNFDFMVKITRLTYLAALHLANQ